jgi:hypothetical protein
MCNPSGQIQNKFENERTVGNQAGQQIIHGTVTIGIAQRVAIRNFIDLITLSAEPGVSLYSCLAALAA